MPNDLVNSVLSSQIWKIFETWSKVQSEAPAVRLHYARHIVPRARFEVVNPALTLSASVDTRRQTGVQKLSVPLRTTTGSIGLC